MLLNAEDLAHTRLEMATNLLGPIMAVEYAASLEEAMGNVIVKAETEAAEDDPFNVKDDAPATVDLPSHTAMEISLNTGRAAAAALIATDALLKRLELME
jgi:hypothetical protein